MNCTNSSSNFDNTTPHVTVVGGGIAGLTVAYYLQRFGDSRNKSINVTILEQSPRLGGKIITEVVDGFVIEGGPDSFINRKPWTLDLCRELQLQSRLLPVNDYEHSFYILRGNKLHPVPSGLRLGVPTELRPIITSTLFSLPAKLRILVNYCFLRRTRSDDASLYGFFRRHFGDEAVQYLHDPLMSGIYSTNPKRQSLRTCFPVLWEVEQEYGSLIRGMIAKRKRPAKSGKDRGPLFTSMIGGMGELVDVLAASFSGSIRTGTTVDSISYDGQRFQVTDHHGQSCASDAVVLAVSARVAAKITKRLNHDLSMVLASFRYATTATVSFGYRKADLKGWEDLLGTGILVPSAERRRVTGCTWTSRKFNGRAPDDCLLIRIFLGGRKGGAKAVPGDDAELMDICRSELSDIAGIFGNPVVSRVFRWPDGNPQYEVGHLRKLKRLKEYCQNYPGLMLIGGAYKGLGIPDCVQEAKATAAKIVSFLGII